MLVVRMKVRMCAGYIDDCAQSFRRGGIIVLTMKLIRRASAALAAFALALTALASPAAAVPIDPSSTRTYIIQSDGLSSLGFTADAMTMGFQSFGIQSITGPIRVTEVDYSRLKATAGAARISGQSRTGDVYCATKRFNGCLDKLQGFVLVSPVCAPEGSVVGLFTFNPNKGRVAPYDLYHVDSATGEGFGESGEYPSGWNLFLARNIPPGVDDFWVGYDAQGLVFYEKRGVRLTCWSPPPPTWP